MMSMVGKMLLLSQAPSQASNSPQAYSSSGLGCFLLLTPCMSPPPGPPVSLDPRCVSRCYTHNLLHTGPSPYWHALAGDIWCSHCLGMIPANVHPTLPYFCLNLNDAPASPYLYLFVFKMRLAISLMSKGTGDEMRRHTSGILAGCLLPG